MLEARGRLLGKEHPDTLTAMNNLAEIQKAQGASGRGAQAREAASKNRTKQALPMRFRKKVQALLWESRP